ncbi:DUF2650 domain-containing protein [Caenorhabditis elegans]|uniref:Transmembrane protein n=1 Tax=Caenorhabditis elegans TaxID=6239 RepID=Q20326_CAEEL|nr:Transmembrane protein [Caenorhabditis elegans]CCD63352.1 Transmembrane protein [Caenorhabditis elegans]|eukprot:NP_501165.3 Uncharacterized protein CELE_F42C5.6 [Caenorhabditis elegans]
MLFSHRKTFLNSCFTSLIQFLIAFYNFSLLLAQNSEETQTEGSIGTTTVVKIESDAIWCPTHRVGNQCPEETLLSFYKCCGHLNKECCFHLRVWIVIMIIVLPICLVLPASTFLIRRILCSSSQQPTGRAPSAADRVRQLAAEDSTTFRRDSDDMVML